MLDPEQFPGAGKAGLDFIGDQQEPVGIGQRAQSLQEFGGGNMEPAFALHRLDDHRGHALGLDIGGKQVLDRGQALFHGVAVDPGGERRVEHFGRHRADLALVGRHFAGHRRGQQRAAVAIAEGRFAKSVVPVLNDDGSVALDREEFPRPETTLEGLSSLKASFDGVADFDLGGTTFRQQIKRRYPDLEWKGVHHAGNSSGVVDGAAAILITSPAYAEKHGLKPRARVVAYANIGDDPTLMLNAPVPAAKKVLAKAGLTKDDIDLWEINEAFAVVAEKFIRDLDLDRSKVNVNGGAMALGHPIGATGSILIGTVLDELERTGGRYGLVTMCAAGGMAPAIIIERM